MTAVGVSDIADVDVEGEGSGGWTVAGERVLGVLGPARVSRPSASLHPSSLIHVSSSSRPNPWTPWKYESSPSDDNVGVIIGSGTVLPSGE